MVFFLIGAKVTNVIRRRIILNSCSSSKSSLNKFLNWLDMGSFINYIRYFSGYLDPLPSALFHTNPVMYSHSTDTWHQFTSQYLNKIVLCNVDSHWFYVLKCTEKYVMLVLWCICYNISYICYKVADNITEYNSNLTQLNHRNSHIYMQISVIVSVKLLYHIFNNTV